MTPPAAAMTTKNWTTPKAMAREFASDLGDRRLDARAAQVGVAVAKKPDRSLPGIFADNAQLEGAYRLLSNPSVQWRDLFEPHRQASLQRAVERGEVLVLHDTTDVSFTRYWSDRNRKHMVSTESRTQGFFAHTSLLATALGPAMPLGVVDLQPFVHWKHAETNDDTFAFWEQEGGLFPNEMARWGRAVEISGESLAERGIGAIHVMDCEADSYGLLSWMKGAGHRFVVRGDGTRKLKPVEPLREVGQLTARLGDRFDLRNAKKVQAHPSRVARDATLHVRAGAVTLQRTAKSQDASWSPGGYAEQPKTLQLNLVEVTEPNPPAGEKPVHWLLLTTEPVETTAQVLQIVEYYRRRWLIEEFFKSLKTGCGLEERQMDSMAAMLRMLALLLPAAWRLLVLRTLAVEDPNAKWDVILTPLEFRLLAGRLRQLKHKLRLTTGATVAECQLGIAALGGHLQRNGAPGWQTLHAGWRELQTMCLGVQVFLEDAIDD
jgi:hypothetical protein